MARAQSNARPESREIRKATFERSDTNCWGCISIKRESWSKKTLHSTASPEYVAGRAMGLAEVDGGLRTSDRAARRALTSSSRGSAAAESRESIPGFR